MQTQKTIKIAGAGPAGLSAAITVADAGEKALVFEGRDNVGGASPGNFQGLENWTTRGDVLEELAAIGIEPSFDYTPCHELVLFDPRGREYHCCTVRPLFYLVRRGSDAGTLDDCLRRQVQAKGVEILFEHTVDCSMDVAIMANGPRYPCIMAVGYLFTTDMADGMYAAVSDDLAPYGYAYLLINGGRGTLASCMFSDFHLRRACLERCVAFFQDKLGLRMINPRQFGGIGNFRLSATSQKGETLYAGEAAGFQDALFGFGIRYALLSGRFAAQAHLAGASPTMNRILRYNHLWERHLNGFMRTAIVNRYFYTRFRPLSYNWLVHRVCKAKEPCEWLRRYYSPSFIKSLWYPIAQRALFPPNRVP